MEPCKYANMEELAAACAACQKCALGETRTKSVFGTGNPSADLLFVGEAPGEQEDLTGTPFVGRAGQLLDKFLYAVDIDRKDVYIANILKCRPPKNRDPLPEEENACIKHLRAQLAMIKPKIIVCLGRISAQKLIKEDFRITAEHGKWLKKGSYEMCAVYHPSALLRDPSKRTAMLSDMWEVKKKAEQLKNEVLETM